MTFQLCFLGRARCLSSSPVNLVYANSVHEWQCSRTKQQTELLWKSLKLIWSNCGCSHGKERKVCKGFSLEGGDAHQWEPHDLRFTWAHYAEEGGGSAQLCGPSRTTSWHLSCVCSTLCFTAAFHNQFWALAVKMVLCKFFCLSNLGSRLLLGGALHWSPALEFMLIGPQSSGETDAFPQVVQWCLELT